MESRNSPLYFLPAFRGTGEDSCPQRPKIAPGMCHLLPREQRAGLELLLLLTRALVHVSMRGTPWTRVLYVLGHDPWHRSEVTLLEPVRQQVSLHTVPKAFSLRSHCGLYQEQGLPLTLRSSHVLNNKQLKGSEVKSSSSAKLQRAVEPVHRCIINLPTFPDFPNTFLRYWTHSCGDSTCSTTTVSEAKK